MKTVFKYITPIGDASVQYGAFMSRDKVDFSCWWNGSGIGGHSSRLSVSKKYLTEWTKKELSIQLEEKFNKVKKIKTYLTGLSKGKFV